MAWYKSLRTPFLNTNVVEKEQDLTQNVHPSLTPGRKETGGPSMGLP